MKNEDYRPATITFDVSTDGTPMPEILGNFPNHQDLLEFLSNYKITAINQALTVSRHMDYKEKVDIRKEYTDILENVLPRIEKEYSIILMELNELKRKEKEAAERVNATITEIKLLSKEVKRGLIDMRLDDIYTFRIPYKGRYYFYTWIYQVAKLCKISDIPEHEKGDLWNAMATNEYYFDKPVGIGELKSPSLPKTFGELMDEIELVDIEPTESLPNENDIRSESDSNSGGYSEEEDVDDFLKGL
jgi:hypothetical protein